MGPELSVMRGRRRLALAAAPLVLLAACAVDLGSLGGSSAHATAVNASGLIVGNANTPGSVIVHGFRTVRGGEMVDLGVGNANDVNDAGVIVGSSDGQAVRWDADGTLVDLGMGAPSVAYGINESGTVVGNAGSEAFLLPAGGPPTILPHVGEEDILQSATAVNDRGDVVGYSVALGTGARAVLWPAPDYQPIVLADKTSDVSATDINNDGTVVGNTTHRYTATALLWTAGTHDEVVLPLGPEDDFTRASAINDAGQVVGTTEQVTDTSATTKAARWDPGATAPVYLGGLGGGSSAGYGIDEAGNAVGAANVGPTPAGSATSHAAFFPHDG